MPVNCESQLLRSGWLFDVLFSSLSFLIQKIGERGTYQDMGHYLEVRVREESPFGG